ncbi:hypothetical protein PSACC_02564 [Paramicrosporidium saccamoebae]|uniref:Uncharacterized protein n=1 Tax=Paramicrosporidium saccamoebae TaxID=1246581 RepID=A0A2H9TJ14_9FUNG|nr:hypothetical protein PSACC_02564 [Paramicrosporidium saccamoebae]
MELPQLTRPLMWPLVLTLAWGLGEALRLAATGSDLQFTVQLEVLFACIKYEEQDVLWNVAGWLMAAPTSVRESYRQTTVPDVLWIFHHVFEHKTLHNILLPLEFLANNPLLLELVDEHWNEYNLDKIELGSYPEVLDYDPWYSRTADYLMAQPYKANGLAAISACWKGHLAFWEIHTIGQVSSCQHSEQLLKLPVLLRIIQCRLQEPERVPSTHLGVPHSLEAALINTLLSTSDVLHVYIKVVTRIKELVDHDGMRALWHGKVTYLALNNPSIPFEHVILLLKDYFSAYQCDEYQFDLIQRIAVQENMRRPRPVYNDSLLSIVMRQLAMHHQGLVPFWAGKSRRLQHWRGTLRSMGQYSPPPEACGWRAVCALFGTEQQFPVMSRWFTDPFVLKNRNGELTTCHDLDCFIPTYAAIVLSESGLFTRTPVGNAFSGAPSIPAVWRTIARIIVLGLVYYQHDVFNLSPETWDLFHTAPTEVDPWDQHFRNNGLSFTHQVLQATRVLQYL